jgi:hypothetical protein
MLPYHNVAPTGLWKGGWNCMGSTIMSLLWGFGWDCMGSTIMVPYHNVAPTGLWGEMNGIVVSTIISPLPAGRQAYGAG